MKKSATNYTMPDLWRIVPIFLFFFYIILAIALPLLLQQLPQNIINLVESWTKIAVNIAAAGAGIWAIYTYRRSKRADASKWMYNLFNEFYTDDKFYWSRDTFEYHYPTIIAPLLELRVTDRYVQLDNKKVEELRNIDLLLNFFEHLLYLEEEGIIITRDREVFFDYWFSFFSYPQRGGLRRYFATCGYERLAGFVRAQETEYVALSDEAFTAIKTLGFGRDKFSIENVENVIIEAFTDYGKVVQGDFHSFPVDDIKTIHAIDKVLDYKADDRKNSKYVRTSLRVNPTNKDCWVYIESSRWKDDYDSKS